jgi:CheY-like chemotaxis protein
LVLLDLRMPRQDGFEVLEWVARQPQLKDLPIVILSGSDVPHDIERARRLGARDYLTKPMHAADYARMLTDVHTRWLAGSPA